MEIIDQKLPEVLFLLDSTIFLILRWIWYHIKKDETAKLVMIKYKNISPCD